MTEISQGRIVQNSVLVSFDAGASNAEFDGPLRVINQARSLTIDSGIGAGTYLPFPELEVKLPDRSGGFEERELTIEIAIEDVPMLERIVDGYPFAPVTVNVYEFLFNDITGDPSTVRHLYKGRLSTATNNVNKMRNVARLTVNNDKGRLNFPLGITANVQCSLVFADTTCKATKIQLVSTVDFVYGTVIALTSAPDPITYPSGLFNKGYVERNGVRILIKDWISGELVYCAKQVPPEWAGQDIVLNSGCDRSLETCVGIYDNQNNFDGLGYLMSAHNPLYEEP
jgi:hypothetical protein